MDLYTKPTSLYVGASSLDVVAFTSCSSIEQFVVCARCILSNLLLKNTVWCVFRCEFGSFLSTNCQKIKIMRSLSNRKWMSTVVDVVDSWREAWYVIASSVATYRCPVVDTVVLDRRCRASSLFVVIVRYRRRVLLLPVDIVRRRWQTLSSSVGTVCRRRRSLPWLTAAIVGRRRGEDIFWLLTSLPSDWLVIPSFFFCHDQA